MSNDGVSAVLRAAADERMDADLSRLRPRLLQAVDRAGLVDIGYRTVDSPMGTLLLAATARGLLRIAFEVEGHASVLARLSDVVSPRIMALPGRLDRAALELDEYFSGTRQAFDLDLDLTLTQGFHHLVVTELRSVGYGQTLSYAALAGRIGHPTASRAVGAACGRNPLPIVVPCHRVLRSDGGLGGYLGGLPAKERLLRLEGAR